MSKLYDYTIKINAYELGILEATLYGNEKIEEYTPRLSLQLRLLVAKVYADSQGHPYQKRATQDVKMYEERLRELED